MSETRPDRTPRRVFAAAVGALAAVMALAACAGRAASAAPTSTAPIQPTTTAHHPVGATPAASPAGALARDERVLRRQSYTPDRYAIGALPSGPLIVIHSVCTGSADGHCQAIHVFEGGAAKPVWVGHYSGVSAFAAFTGGFSVTSVQYAPSDPLCCPSRPPLTRRYRWDGARFVLERPGAQVSP